MTSNQRVSEYAVDDLFLKRWSPRSMTGEHISDEQLLAILEAGRWAPSSRNEQPWKFIYAIRESGEWQSFLDILAETNRVWAKNASALVLVVSKNTHDRDASPNRFHSFDAGAAWMSIALQATMSGFVAHAMGGIDIVKAKTTCSVPDEYSIECMVAIGKQGEKELLPPAIAEREFPNSRKPLQEIAVKGRFV